MLLLSWQTADSWLRAGFEEGKACFGLHKLCQRESLCLRPMAIPENTFKSPRISLSRVLHELNRAQEPKPASVSLQSYKLKIYGTVFAHAIIYPFS